MLQSRTTRRFREQFGTLSAEAQQEAREAYRLFKANPNHPGLRFKKIEGSKYTYSVRIGLGYRALGVFRGDTIDWLWIGSHAQYDRLTESLSAFGQRRPSHGQGYGPNIAKNQAFALELNVPYTAQGDR